MIFFYYLIIITLGLLAGSFLNCIIYRLENNQGFLKGRSYCPKCKKEISWFDLIPVISFIILKGKCRNCQDKISLHYPLVEIITAGLFLFIYYYFSPQVSSLLNVTETIYVLIVFFVFLLIFIYDLKHFIIPDSTIIFISVVILIWFIIGFFNNIFSLTDILLYVFSGIGASLFFLFFYLVSKGTWMGFGDVKFAIVLGLFLGFPKIIIALFLAFLLGALIGLIAIALKKKGLKSEIPFAPFLIIGTFISFFWGQSLLTWYLSFL